MSLAQLRNRLDEQGLMDSLRDIYDYYFAITGESYIKTTCLGKPEAFNIRNMNDRSKNFISLPYDFSCRTWSCGITRSTNES